ncbi:DUF424 family protein [Candidatus Woesearchaeota archaeon]|nr:DUF424 family protein [Candidatus Woesearchaeota archaeon]
MIVKKHVTHEGKVIIAICDSDLLGKKFEQDDLQLDLTSDFYNGEEKTESEIKEIIKEAYLLNIIGKKSIQFFLNLGIIDKDHIIKISGVPHAQAMIIRED